MTTPETSFNLHALYQIIHDRKEHPKENSYTCQLFSLGEDEILKKIGEEAIEVILAAKAQGDQRLIEELSDLVYHTLVLLVQRGLTIEDIQHELARRHR